MTFDHGPESAVSTIYTRAIQRALNQSRITGRRYRIHATNICTCPDCTHRHTTH